MEFLKQKGGKVPTKEEAGKTLSEAKRRYLENLKEERGQPSGQHVHMVEIAMEWEAATEEVPASALRVLEEVEDEEFLPPPGPWSLDYDRYVYLEL